MRDRIKLMRATLVERLHEHIPNADFRFVLASARHVFVFRAHEGAGRTAARDFSIYAVDTGRICVAALNSRNVDEVARAVAVVLA